MAEERYKVSPTGKRIWATADSLLASAELMWNADGTWEHVGESKMHWDTQVQRLNGSGQPLFEDEDGEEWPFELLVWNDEYAKKDARVSQFIKVGCDNCDWEGREDEVNAIEDLSMRVGPGEVMPYGECPECGCLCHAKNERPTYDDIVEVLTANLEAWDGEEDSVKEEHADLIAKTGALLDRIKETSSNVG